MAGHSHWANIKRKKEAVDNKRGKIWTKLSKAISVAASMGGGDPDANPRLRLAIADAKSARMPNDTIDRAIKRGTGDLKGSSIEEILYEGYGPAGVAVMVDVLTDNRNRTASELRKIFDTSGGNLGATGCVAWNFDRKGVINIPLEQISEDRLMEIALEAGADDIQREEDGFTVTCQPEVYSDVQEALEAAGIEVDSSSVTRLPKDSVEVEGNDARKLMKLMAALDDHDDVQGVSANFNISDEVLEEIEG
ncbi:YebC/PmpR family DNA-binding transcriptional regulator [Bremerella cremea]|uniref:Probable transcriptional regulatory protein DTL42_22270 n=1 Tax=Bremerella cremea TaxID=1031537 RepID=A0A368KMR8_9BACT|nr:YebC/PmpR family DNA-binding transcriptional regulator [Bremerella cremea]RCS41295.1 YebC/PmpR family DNA-binding transcriptional regulator [Bremerella cremea]